MNEMFQATSASNIKGLEHFDTAAVIDMYQIFSDNYNVRTLDLSAFDLSKTTNTDSMFHVSYVTTVYCRTEEDMQKMQTSFGCGATGFVVGKPTD